MEYRLQIENRTLVLSTGGTGAHPTGPFVLTCDQTPHDLVCTRLSAHHLHLFIDGRGYHLFVHDDGPHAKTVHINGRPYRVVDADRNAALPAQRRRRTLPETVTPPMPAVVVRLLVAEGEAVTGGDPVVVVSAMKMETTLKAPFSGTVDRIHVQVGDKVAPGQVLVDIVPDPRPPVAAATGE